MPKLAESLWIVDSENIDGVLELVDPQLRAILARYAIPWMDSEDLIQEAVLATLPKWGEIQNKHGWLLRTVRNLCTSYQRKRKCWGRLVYTMDPETLQATAKAALGPPQVSLDVIRDLNKLLSALNARERQILILRYCEGLGPTEVASRIGCHPASVRKSALRIMARLREAAKNDLTDCSKNNPT